MVPGMASTTARTRPVFDDMRGQQARQEPGNAGLAGRGHSQDARDRHLTVTITSAGCRRLTSATDANGLGGNAPRSGELEVDPRCQLAAIDSCK